MSSISAKNSRRPTNCVALSPGVQSTFLCSACLCIFAGDPDRYENKNDTSGGWSSNIFSHHDTPTAFKAAAEDDCYICSRFDAQLRDQLQDALQSKIYEDESKWESPASTYELSLGTRMAGGWSEAELRINAKFPDQKMYGIEFLLFSSNDYEISQQLSPRIGSLQSLGKAQNWLEACARSGETYHENPEGLSISSNSQELGERDHLPCTLYSTSGYVPTRLLDIRNMTAGSWKVCLPFEDSIGVISYATLSYCWGNVSFLKLTQQLLPDFRAGKPVSQLPRLFQDAMIVTRHLGFQYIWIDALCILQDSKEDFTNEVAKMAEIYSNTAINIIAAACQNPFESLFKARDLRSYHIGRFWPSWDTTDQFFATLHSVDSIMETESLRRDFENASTRRRGWILQERVLPPRRLYFFRTQLYYVCRTSEACEIFPDVVPDLLKSYSEIYDLPSPSHQQSPFENWKLLAEEYSNCSFTNPGDKIIALSGLIKAFETATGDDYVAGLWRSKLPLTLGWYGSGDSRRRRSALNIAPTWSWLSIDGEINFGITGIICTHHTVICDILDISKVPAYAISTDPLEIEVLTLRTPSFPVCVAVDGSLTIPYFSGDRAEDAKFYPDDTYEKLTAGTRLIMAILTVEGVCEKYLNQNRHIMEGATDWKITALILQQDEGKDCYHRVGCFSIKTKEPHTRIGKSQLLDQFGLMIKNSFGRVIVTDDNNWTDLRII